MAQTQKGVVVPELIQNLHAQNQGPLHHQSIHEFGTSPFSAPHTQPPPAAYDDREDTAAVIAALQAQHKREIDEESAATQKAISDLMRAYQAQAAQVPTISSATQTQAAAATGTSATQTRATATGSTSTQTKAKATGSTSTQTQACGSPAMVEQALRQSSGSFSPDYTPPPSTPFQPLGVPSGVPPPSTSSALVPVNSNAFMHAVGSFANNYISNVTGNLSDLGSIAMSAGQMAMAGAGQIAMAGGAMGGAVGRQPHSAEEAIIPGRCQYTTEYAGESVAAEEGHRPAM